ncbi:hypothetical protein FRB97_004812 [Tulasnella sp. 331]|nr:hypothetical protein FRB97_004812 [Tulasnella sp. 331]
MSSKWSINPESISSLLPKDQALFAQYALGKRVPAPFHTIHEAFEHHARLNPGNVAVEHLDESITYGELDYRSDELAWRLREKGVRPGARVMLLARRSVPYSVAIIAVLKAGGQYVPVDGTIATDSTIHHILVDAAVNVVICMEAFLHRVVYAGTTGKPKGVDIRHSNVTNLVCLEPGNLGMKPGLRVSQLLNIQFDMAQWECLGAWANGCTLVIRGRDWKSVLKTVNIVISTPTILLPYEPVEYPNIAAVATAGEPCPQYLADKWATAGVVFYNSCGPTEITIVNTVQPHTTVGYTLSIGIPTPNNSVYILDEDMKPVPIGSPGLMWAGGAGVARSYVGMKSNKFQRDPFLDDGRLMYNTGDLGKWRDDGQLEHLGRADDQVKIKGFRVELDGVSAAIETAEGVAAASALLIKKELVGFVTPDNIDIELVKVAVARIQPYYANPSRYITMAEFPKTANGKTDKRALRALVEHPPVPALDIAPALEPVPVEIEIILPPKPQVEVPQPISTSEPQPVFMPLKKYQEQALSMSTIAVRSGNRTSLISIAAGGWTDFTQTQQVDPMATFTIHPAQFQSWHQLQPSYNTLNSTAMITVGGLPSTAAASLRYGQGGGMIDSKEFDSFGSGEKGDHNGWEGYQDDVIPQKSQSKVVRNLRYIVFTLYRRLFSIMFIVNMVVLIVELVRGGLESPRIAIIVTANLLVSILMRQDYVINIFFNVLCAVPLSWPLWIRRTCAKVYHIGGLHSGCAVSAVFWFTYLTAQLTIDVTHHKVSTATLVLTYVINVFLYGILAFAAPAVRSKSHNNFERTHRFAGWSVLILVWAQFVLLTHDTKAYDQSLCQAIVHSAAFWMLLVLTGSIILPWIKLRKVPVRAEVLSSHAVRLWFDEVTPITGSFRRISNDPLMEWHSFATVPVPGKTGYSLVVSRAGDWTGNAISNPPTHLWVRGIPTFGVLRILPLLRSVVMVATGRQVTLLRGALYMNALNLIPHCSGIGPCMPAILEKRIPIKLIWTSPNVRETFGDALVDSILEANPDAIIYDTRKHGKPDMVKLTLRLVREFNAEAVAIISNQKLTKKVVYGMESRGIPAFGAIWDS